MGNKIYNKKLAKACKYCVHSHDFGSEDELLCAKRGAVSYDDCCGKYKYDATKRVPVKPMFANTYSNEDFTL